MTEGIADIETVQSSRKTRQFTLNHGLKPCIIYAFLKFFKFNIQCDHRNNYDAICWICSLANSMIYRAVQNYKIRKNYLTFSSTTVSTSIRFPRASLPRLLNFVHAAVVRECCDGTKFSTRVLNLVPLLNLAPLNLKRHRRDSINLLCVYHL
jgi:hypothetical protein